MKLLSHLDIILNQKDYFRFYYSNKPIIIYGAGQLGEAASKYLLHCNLNIICFLDKNPNIIGKKINGIEVIHPDTMTSWQKSNCTIAIGLVKFPYNTIREYLLELGCNDVCYIGHLVCSTYSGASIANVWYFDNMLEDEKKMIEYCFNNYSDDESRKNTLQLLEWICNGKEVLYSDNINNSEDKYFPKETCEALSDEEVFADCGAYNGNSISRIDKLTNGKYKGIYCFEPDPFNYKELVGFVEKHDNRTIIKTQNYGLGSEDNFRNFTVGLGLTARYSDSDSGELIQMKKLDTAMNNSVFTFLKVYGLGIGWEVIKGGIGVLKKNRPIIAINIHHSRNDFVKIPYILMTELTNYTFHLRLHGYCGSEAVVYAIPNERRV